MSHLLIAFVLSLPLLPGGNEESLQAAQDAAANLGYPVPPGWTVEFGKTSGSRMMGETIVDDTLIIIDASKVDQFTNGAFSDDPSQRPGVLVNLVIHEVQHANDPDTVDDICAELSIMLNSMSVACTLAGTAVDVLGATSEEAQNLCTLHEARVEAFNKPGGLGEAWTLGGCGNTAPVAPDCEPCP